MEEAIKILEAKRKAWREKDYKKGFADGKMQGELEAMARIRQGIKNYINNEQTVVDEDDLVKIIMGGK